MWLEVGTTTTQVTSFNLTCPHATCPGFSTMKIHHPMHGPNNVFPFVGLWDKKKLWI
jgi:hypothetical protein